VKPRFLHTLDDVLVNILAELKSLRRCLLQARHNTHSVDTTVTICNGAEQCNADGIVEAFQGCRVMCD
jgi:hypothetical protein